MKSIVHVVCNPSTGVLSLISSLLTEQLKKNGNEYNYSVIIIYDRFLNIDVVQSELDGLETKNIYSPVKINSMFYLFFYCFIIE